MNKLSLTLSTLSNIIDHLNLSRELYGKILKTSPEYEELLLNLFKQKEYFLNKILNEYKRLSGKEYLLNENRTYIFQPFSLTDAAYECLVVEEKLIDLYSDALNQDLLWEVYPLLARQRHMLKSAGKKLIEYINQFKENSINLGDFADHEVN